LLSSLGLEGAEEEGEGCRRAILHCLVSFGCLSLQARGMYMMSSIFCFLSLALSLFLKCALYYTHNDINAKLVSYSYAGIIIYV
jgi:hypothetical protein